VDADTAVLVVKVQRSAANTASRRRENVKGEVIPRVMFDFNLNIDEMMKVVIIPWCVVNNTNECEEIQADTSIG